jgi:CheY-like chemotaxis protein
VSARRVLVVVPDLFFIARIRATAATLGVEIEEATSEAALAACRSAPPHLVILDLQAAGDPISLARTLKSDAAMRPIPIVGFYSHVEGATRSAAIAAGVDRVMPRSAFTAKLAELLQGNA